MNFKDLNGDRIDLVTINENGLDDMYEYSKKPEFYRYLEHKPHKNIEDTRKYLKRLVRLTKSGKGHYWFIKLKAENKIIGTFGASSIDKRRNSAVLGYGVSPDYGERGYFSEALMMALKYLFTELHFHRLFVQTRYDNFASIAGIEKAGFKREGVFREFYLARDGKRYDAALYSLLRDEYLQNYHIIPD